MLSNLATLKHLNLNHFCHFSCSMLLKRFCAEASRLGLIPSMRLDGKEDCKISKISFVSFTFRATIYPLWREIRKNVTQIHTKTIDKHLHEPFDHTVKCGLFSDFQYGFRSSRATADRLAVVSNRIARAFSRSLATRTVALDMPKAFNRV